MLILLLLLLLRLSGTLIIGRKTAGSKCSPLCCSGLEELQKGLALSAGAAWGCSVTEVARLDPSHPLWGSIQSLWHWHLISAVILSPQKGPLTSGSLSTKGWSCAPNLCRAELMNVWDERQQAENFIASQPRQARLKWAWKLHSPLCCTSVKQTWIKRHTNSGVKKKNQQNSTKKPSSGIKFWILSEEIIKSWSMKLPIVGVCLFSSMWGRSGWKCWAGRAGKKGFLSVHVWGGRWEVMYREGKQNNFLGNFHLEWTFVFFPTLHSTSRNTRMGQKVVKYKTSGGNRVANNIPRFIS